jgi:alpha-L-fucosidase 2
MAIFWENYLLADGTEYDIVNDAQQEDDPSPQTNGVMSLGLVRFLLQAVIDISTALNVDAAERTIWQDRLMNLAPFPTYTGCPGCQAGETVFRYTSVGRDWCDGNTIGIQHIYPASQIGLSSDPSLLQIANNMIDVMARWNDGNGTDTFYPAAARVGYDPATILSNLDSWIQNNTYPNLHIHTGGGGLENLNTVPATIAEMLLQSFQGTIRVFPDWPSGTDAKFANLRAYGGFLVASQTSNNAAQYVAITSQMGGPFTLVNPWGQAEVAVYENGASAPSMSGVNITVQTNACDVIVLAPGGTSYASVVAQMNAQ